jgi:hypothetical protein
MAGRMTTTRQFNSDASSASASERGRGRLFKRGVVGLLAALLLALGQVSIGGGMLTASAHDDCQYASTSAQYTDGSPWNCNYTQIESGNWPGNSSSPQCGSTCWFWWMPNGGPGNVDADFTGAYPNVSGVDFYNDLLTAMHGWGSQPYNSPLMYQCGGSNCQYSQVHVGSKDEGSGRSYSCALTYVYADSNTHYVTSSTIMLNNNGGVWWVDGPTGSQGGCDAKSMAYHEEGHVFTLGHSSANADVMYWGGGDVSTVTGNAQTGLNAIYGPYNGHGGSGGGGSGQCPNCQTICGASENPCNPGPGGDVSIQAYLTKAWDMSQGVSIPNAVSTLIGADGCLQYFFTKQYTLWLNCQIGISGL